MMRFWSGLPSFTGYGPTGKSLQAGHMDMMYDQYCEDAMSIAQTLEELGEKVEIVDVKTTFASRWSNPQNPAVMLWPDPREK